MARLEELLKQIEGQSEPPVETWNPDHCATMNLVIDRQGQWHHEGQIIHRQGLVNLFASVLMREQEEYFLVTPVEKVKIEVECTPFVCVAAELIDDRWFITNNLGEVKELSDVNCLDSSDDQNPTLFWRRNLPARVNQSVFYQWQVHALEHGGLDDEGLWLKSGGARILLERLG